MKYVVMVSHGEFAPGLHSAVKMMTGDREDVLSTSLKDGMSADEFASNFAELIKDFKAIHKCIECIGSKRIATKYFSNCWYEYATSNHCCINERQF